MSARQARVSLATWASPPWAWTARSMRARASSPAPKVATGPGIKSVATAQTTKRCIVRLRWADRGQHGDERTGALRAAGGGPAGYEALIPSERYLGPLGVRRPAARLEKETRLAARDGIQPGRGAGL